MASEGPHGNPKWAALAAEAADGLGLPLVSLAPELSGLRIPPFRTSVDWAGLDPYAVGELYRECAPADEKAVGRYYTPSWVARLLADETLRPCGADRPRVLDPACGCGGLLVAAMEHLTGCRGLPPDVAARLLHGFDRDAGSIIMARVAVLLAARSMGATERDFGTIAPELASQIVCRDVLASRPTLMPECIVINPPYVRAARGAPEERRELRRAFRTAVGAFDLQVPFIELSLDLLPPGGLLGVLASNKVLVADYARELRRHIHRGARVHRVVDLADCPGSHPGAQISQTVLIAERGVPAADHGVELLRVEAPAGGRPSLLHVGRRAQATLLSERWPTLRATPSDAGILRRMTDGGVAPLDSLALVRGGVRGFDYEACCREVREANGSLSGVRVLTPGNIRAYRAPARRPVRLKGREWREPCLIARPDAVTGELWDLFGRPKLVVKGVGPRPTAAVSLTPSAPFVAVWGIWGDDEVLWILAGLINSLPVAWLHYQQLCAARIPQGSMRLPLSWLRGLPVPTTGLSSLADLARRRAGASTALERAALQRQADEQVAAAYGLSDGDLRTMQEAPVRPVQT